MGLHHGLKIGYGMLSLALSLVHNVMLLYHVQAYTNVFELDRTSFVVAELAFLIWNSVNDLLFGWLSDSFAANKRLTSQGSDNIERRLK